ncbi:SPP1 gp7 family putative phage head morphogenesis protein [Labrenzia sp. EL_126]|nr:SPP1 gp7 family putative phage head morphogenesis protein [Labrenzia sp. EL_126]
MLKYSLAKLGRETGRRRGTFASLPVIVPRLSTERVYEAALRKILKGIAREVRDGIIPAFQAERRQRRTQAAFQQDVEREWFRRLLTLRVELSRVATETVERVFRLEARRHTDSFLANAKRAFGIDLRAVVRQEDLEEYLRAAAGRNASLIQNVSDDLQKRIEQTVYANSIAGNSVKKLREELKTQFGFVEKRARLIARDQTAKLNSDLNRVRQEQAGVTSYVWMTSRDERVRARHKRLDGKQYKWGQSTGAESGLPPGQPVNCRCVARGVVKF